MQDREYKFTVENRRLLTDQTTAKILYSYRMENFGNADADFIKVVYYSLAIEIGYKLTKDKEVRMELKKDLREDVLPTARFNGAIERLEDKSWDDPTKWIRVRNQALNYQGTGIEVVS